MNIKKIIQEEIDSFDWVDKITDTVNYNNVEFTIEDDDEVYHIRDGGGDYVHVFDSHGSFHP